MVSTDAEGRETKVTAQIRDEYFTAKGLIVDKLNWLEIFKYDKWYGSKLPDFNEGDVFEPSEFTMEEGETSKPKLLTESDLITLMDKGGIGTDATIHEHIKTIQDRGYAIKKGQEIVPTTIGV